MAAEIQLAILQQTLKLAPLSPKYLKWKKDNGLDRRTLIAEGHYVSEIKARRKAGGEIEVGLPDTNHPTAGIPYKQLARIHEYGSEKQGIPERPVWRPMLAKFRKRFPKINKRIQDRINQIIFKKIAKGLKKNTKKITRL